MASCVVKGAQPLDNPTAFTNDFQFEITVECISPLTDDLEWALVYVGSADSADFDQTLESVFLGPVQVGLSKFVFQAPPPDIKKIPEDEIVGVTAILLTGRYKNKEFIRIGWYVSNEYTEPSYVEYKAKFDEEQKRRDEEDARQEEEEEDIMDVDEEEEEDDGEEDGEDDDGDGEEDDERGDGNTNSNGHAANNNNTNANNNNSVDTTPRPLSAVAERLGQGDSANNGAGSISMQPTTKKRPALKPISPVRWAHFDPSLIKRTIQPVYFDEKTDTGYPRVTMFNDVDWS